MENQIISNIEIVWWLENSYHIPMDIIRYIMIEWISYPVIESNEKFRECISLWFNVKDEKQAERDAMIKKYGHISDWNTKKITNMSKAFSLQAYFTEDLSRWDVSNVINMSYMFYHCDEFNGDLSHWDVSNVRNMSYMFASCHTFNGDLSHWDVSNVSDMSFMFYYCKSFNCDLSTWQVIHVINSQFMFYGCHELIYFTTISELWFQINSRISF